MLCILSREGERRQVVNVHELINKNDPVLQYMSKLTQKRFDNSGGGMIKNDDCPLEHERIVDVSSLPCAKFASVTYREVELSGPAASPLGFPAPHGKFSVKLLIVFRLLSHWLI